MPSGESRLSFVFQTAHSTFPGPVSVNLATLALDLPPFAARAAELVVLVGDGNSRPRRMRRSGKFIAAFEQESGKEFELVFDQRKSFRI